VVTSRSSIAAAYTVPNCPKRPYSRVLRPQPDASTAATATSRMRGRIPVLGPRENDGFPRVFIPKASFVPSHYVQQPCLPPNRTEVEHGPQALVGMQRHLLQQLTERLARPPA
jgi:hypothetical protein